MFQQIVARIRECPHLKKSMNLGTDLIPFTKINSNQISELNVKCKTLKFIGNIGRKNWIILCMALTF